MSKPTGVLGAMLRFWTNKYLWTIVAFVVIVGFIDTNSIVRRWELHSHNEALRAEIKNYEGIYNENISRLEALKTDQRAIEQVARVHFHYQRANEDIYDVTEGE